MRRASTRHVKLLLAFVLLAGLAAVAVIVVAGMGRLLFVTERGGKPAPIENPIVDLTVAEPGSARWRSPDPDAGRQLDQGTLDRITDAYLRAWLGIELALETCSGADLHTWFAPGPESQVKAIVEDAKATGCTLRRADGSHTLQPTFVSEDGGIVAFRDTGAWVVDRVVDPAGRVRYLERTTDRDVVMRLDDGLWRVAAWRETASAPADDVPPLATGAPGFVSARGGELILDGEPWHLDGVNYYPAATPWRDFWTKYDAAVVETDLRRAVRLGFDAVRIFVPYGPGPDHPDELALTGLDDFLDRADALGLKVVVTLFDLDVNHDPQAWSGTDRYVDRVVGRYAFHPAILAWDLKNEADLDDKRVGASLVDQWLTHVLRRLRTLDSIHLVTVGWSSAAQAPRLADRLDLVTFHDYLGAAGLGDRLAAAGSAVTAAVPGGRPTLLTEYGASSWGSPLAPGGAGAAGQAREVAALRAAIAADPTLDGGMLWALNDFTRGAASPPGASAWRKGVERSFGVIDVDGQDKLVAGVLVGGEAPGTSLLPGPWLLMVLVAAGLGFLRGAAFAWRRRRQGRIRAIVLGAAFVPAYALGYVVLGLAFTFLVEMLKLPGMALWVLAVMALVGAAIGAEVVVQVLAVIWLRVRARLSRPGGRRWRRRRAAVADARRRGPRPVHARRVEAVPPEPSPASAPPPAPIEDLDVPPPG